MMSFNEAYVGFAILFLLITYFIADIYLKTLPKFIRKNILALRSLTKI